MNQISFHSDSIVLATIQFFILNRDWWRLDTIIFSVFGTCARYTFTLHLFDILLLFRSERVTNVSRL